MSFQCWYMQSCPFPSNKIKVQLGEISEIESRRLTRGLLRHLPPPSPQKSIDEFPVLRTRASYQLIYITVAAINANVKGGNKKRKERIKLYKIKESNREREEEREIGYREGDKKSTLVAIYFWVLFILNFTSVKLLMRCPNVTEPFCQINMLVVVPVVVVVVPSTSWTSSSSSSSSSWTSTSTFLGELVKSAKEHFTTAQSSKHSASVYKTNYR